MSSKFSKVFMGTLAGVMMTGAAALAEGPAAKNLILFVVDGFSVENLTMLKPNMKALLDGGNLLMVSPTATEPVAAVSAMASGKLTNPGMLNMSPDATLTGYDSIVTRVVPEQGLKTAGLVTTGNVTDGSVSAFYAHAKDYANSTDFIASQAVVNGYDVMLGGGKSAFLTKDQGGIRESDDEVWTGVSSVYKVVNDEKELAAISDSKSLVLGLFDGVKPALVDMTSKALEVLADSKEGFALIVNESRTDLVKNPKADGSAWDALDLAVGAAVNFASKTPETLVVVAGTVDTEETFKRVFLSTKIEYIYTSVPVPVLAGGSSSAASTFKGFAPGTGVFKLLAAALGASSK